MTAKTPEQRIADLGLSLPPAPAAVANYVPWVITGNLLMTSGNLPRRDGKLAYIGKIGHEISGEDGYKSCQLSCLNVLARPARHSSLRRENNLFASAFDRVAEERFGATAPI